MRLLPDLKKIKIKIKTKKERKKGGKYDVKCFIKCDHCY